MDKEIKLAKEVVGAAAAKLVLELASSSTYKEKGLILGLGTGSTAQQFIESLSKLLKKSPKNICAVPSSITTEKLASRLGIPLADSKKITEIDITVDGADLVDEKGQIIKGYGGALLREKLLASCSNQFIVMIDETKKVSSLLAAKEAKLPIEIVPFMHLATQKKIEKLGACGVWRTTADSRRSNPFFVTDNQNFIFDLSLKNIPFETVELLHQALKEIPGVVDTGLFSHFATKLITSHFSGKVIIEEIHRI